MGEWSRQQRARQRVWLKGVDEEGVKKETKFLRSSTFTLRELGTTGGFEADKPPVLQLTFLIGSLWVRDTQ